MARPASIPLARHGRLRRSRPWATVLTFIGATLAVVLVAGASLAGVAVFDVAESVKPGVHLINETEGPAPQIGAHEGEVNVLLAGSDSGGGDVKTYGKRGEHLNDVTMLLHVSADHTQATVVSFPRDLIIPIASCPNPAGGTFRAQTNKMNTALTFGGLPCIVQTVENLTGLSIPYAGLIEFQGVIAMSNAVGGVQVCVATAIHDRQIGFDLAAGTPTIQGNDALQFLRSRYGVGDGSDVSRISNQQVFLSALVRKIKDAGTLSNPVVVYQLAKAAADNISLSDSLRSNINNIVSLGLTLKDIDPANITFVQYPSADGTLAGYTGLVPLKTPATALFAALKSDTPIAVTGGTGAFGAKTDPNSTAPATTAPSPAATGNSTEAPTVDLPTAVHGQTAAEQTCSRGQTAGGHG